MELLSLDAQTLGRLLSLHEELVSTDPDLGTLMDLVCRRSEALTGAQGAAVELAEGDEMVYRASSGMATGQLGLRIPREGSFSGLCVEQRQALVCEDSEIDSRVNRQACRAVGLRSMVVQPLFYRDRTIGVVKVMSPLTGAFDEAVPVLLGSLAKVVAGVLANALRWNELKSDRDNLSHLASHDAMTGVRNRSAFYDHLRQAIAQAHRTQGRVGLALFDLDGLKAVNDTHGHQAGDFFIRSFAERLARRVRESDTVARLGGDEFGVVFVPTDHRTDLQDLGRQWADESGGTVDFQGAALALKASTGVAVFADDGADPETLVARADERLYQDKRARKGR
jgi:diguanylate cyclase (GGDEF)-like protein